MVCFKKLYPASPFRNACFLQLRDFLCKIAHNWLLEINYNTIHFLYNTFFCHTERSTGMIRLSGLNEEENLTNQIPGNDKKFQLIESFIFDLNSF